ncbi:hypothetical protein LTR62_008407 [Meristemomyces frigidus]|uniref:Uncharacterized protein n=1 Tax=Meristemomyces frigidus TaxID=1508187 RepID=A0AAN7T9Z5_9PEZI|nr:hypothetical protein LTR62_008407 [Meristemomyces frigidus]
MPAMENLLLTLWIALMLFRYIRTIVGMYTYIFYRPKPIQTTPTYTTNDVTVIVPTTFKSATELTHCLRCISACSPAAILVVTAVANVSLVEQICSLKTFRSVEVLGVEKLNKRLQMIKALKQVNTDIVVFADDDVFWPEQYLHYLLAIFEDPSVGAGGTRQRVRRNSGLFINFWNFLGISYLERRVWNNITTNAIDGSISTLSGRTSAYRTRILKSEEFFRYFTNDSWRGRPLNTDDDKCLTRYVYSHGWAIVIQADSRSVIETTLEDNPKFISQCLRWARAHWRGNFTVMENETYWRSGRYWWGLYVVYVGQFQTPALLVDGLLFGLLYCVLQGSAFQWSACYALICWMLFTKTAKLIPHLLRYPQDLLWLPAGIVFSYVHGILNIYALLTLTNTTWGSQSLAVLERARATQEAVVPLLQTALCENENYQEPKIGMLLK